MSKYANDIDVFNLTLVDDDPVKLSQLESYTVGEYYAYVSARHNRAKKR